MNLLQTQSKANRGWTNIYDNDEQVQQIKQYHVHMLNVDAQKREHLATCRRQDFPDLCKADFP